MPHKDKNRPLRILVLEDEQDDFDLLIRQLRKEELAVETRRVQTEADFKRELGDFRPDLVISDYAMPAFNGLAALRIHVKTTPDTPFLFVSGTIGEDTAVQALKEGATDYLLKGHLMRLGQAVRRAVDESRARVEKRRLELELYHSQKMEAIGRLAGGVAHDFNNLLTAIMGYTEIMEEGLPPGDPMRGNLSEVRNAGRRAADLTRQLLAFGRKQVLTPRVTDVNEVLSGLLRLVARLIGENIELKTNLEPGLKNIYVDPGQLEQVIMNLVVNARDAMPRGGAILLGTRMAEPDAGVLAVSEGARPGLHVLLEVVDNGSGMSPETMARMFEPFFTTKGVGKGTGLGLATVFGIVRQSEGFIHVESAPGRGSVFSVYFPPATVPGLPPGRPLPPVPLPPGTGTILLVEDEEAVRKLAAHVLSAKGYRVLEAESGIAARDLVGDKEAIDLLLTDLVMPKMGGHDLAVHLRRNRPGLRVIYMSGYAPDAVLEGMPPEPGATFLNKPFSTQELVRKVQEKLGAGAKT
ncbi:MAG: response regulator [Planctomycetia bacterium]|nr:response regulator [Planctomycetia bacterium]